MIQAVRRIPVVRYALIVSLIIVLFISAFYLYLYYSKAVRLRYNVAQMVSARESAAKIDSCLLYLYTADNNSRLYTLTGEEMYYKKFSEEINFVNRTVQQLDNNNLLPGNILYQKIDTLVDQKAGFMQSDIYLRTLSDSLLLSAAKINEAVVAKKNQVVVTPVLSKVISKTRIDTIRVPEKGKPRRRKFFGRLLAAFASPKAEASTKKHQAAEGQFIIKKKYDTLVQISPFTAEMNARYHNNYQKMLNTSADLKENEESLLATNKKIIDEIISKLKSFKQSEQLQINSSRVSLESSLHDVVFRFRNLSGLIFLFLISLVSIILYNIWKIFRSEKQLLSYSLKTEQYAQSKSAFLASMSHEIRTPLNSVIGFSEQLGQGTLDHKQQEQVNAISASSKMLLEVVNEILDFSKFETGKMSFDQQPFNVCKVLDETYNTLKIQADTKGILLVKKFNLDPQLCIKGDAFRLKQVIVNFLSNAVKFTSSGAVTLKARVREDKTGRKLLGIQVRDSGLGISKENLEHIFGEFSQVDAAQEKASQKGTGLGLAISKKIIELQGGKISVSSELGKGSVFGFELPFELAVEIDDCKVQDLKENENNYQELAGLNILIAEDNNLNVLLLKTILKKMEDQCGCC